MQLDDDLITLALLSHCSLTHSDDLSEGGSDLTDPPMAAVAAHSSSAERESADMGMGATGMEDENGMALDGPVTRVPMLDVWKLAVEAGDTNMVSGEWRVGSGGVSE